WSRARELLELNHDADPQVALLHFRDAERQQQALLAQRVELDHAIGPRAFDAIECIAQSTHPAAADPAGAAVDRIRAEFDARRADRRGWIDAHPAAAVEPDLGPRMRIRATHQQVLAARDPPAALVAGHHARRDAG